MLPIKKRKDEASVSAPPDHILREPDDGADEYDSLEGAMQELAGHLISKNWKAAAECFRAAIELCASDANEEGEHV